MDKSDWSKLSQQVKKQVPWNLIQTNPRGAMNRASELAFKVVNKDYVKLCYYLYKSDPNLEFKHDIMLIAAARVGHSQFVQTLLEDKDIPMQRIRWAMRVALKRKQFETFSIFTPYIDDSIFDFILSQERFWPALTYLYDSEWGSSKLQGALDKITNKEKFLNIYVASPWALEHILLIPEYLDIFTRYGRVANFGDSKKREQLYYTCVRDNLPVALQYYISSGKFSRFANDTEPKLYANLKGYQDILAVLSAKD